MRIDLPNPDRFKQIFDSTMSKPLVEKVTVVRTIARYKSKQIDQNLTTCTTIHPYRQ